MSLKYNEGSLEVDIFDKRQEFPFPVIRYPQADSLIPNYMPYAVYLGQLHRFYRICNSPQAFLKNALSLAKTLLTQRCPKGLLLKGFGSFLSGKTPLRWGTGLSGLLKTFRRRVNIF